MSRFVVRPGETEFDVQDRIQGDLNLPMTGKGISQVKGIVEALRARDLDIIYTSQSQPALAAAEAIAKELRLPLKVLPNLANINLGLWQGLTRSEIRQKQPKLFRQWEDAPESVCAPMGESCDQAAQRSQKALRKLLKKRESFAVVASEPIATMIVSVLKGDKPKLCGPVDMAGCRSHVECLEPAIAVT